jgi:hypothetical protein
MRALWETWLVATYCLLKGPEALKALAADYAHYGQLLGTGLGLGAAWQHDIKRWLELAGSDPKPRPLKYLPLAQEVDALLAAKGETQCAVEGYNRLFRGESFMTAHAGLASLIRYVRAQKQTLEINRRPVALPSRAGTEVMAAIYTANLARLVFDEFGIRGDRLEKAADRLPSFNPDFARVARSGQGEVRKSCEERVGTSC